MTDVPPSFTHSVLVAAPAARVWRFLTDIGCMKAWMGEPEMALEIATDWTVGAPIVVRGVHHLPFENIGTVLAFEPPRRLAYTHRSSLSRLPEVPESDTRLDFLLQDTGRAIALTLTASGFPSASIYRHLQFYWGSTLEILRRQVEQAMEASVGSC
jgi:uncharacterized protein YndB with AHSA1/START domain